MSGDAVKSSVYSSSVSGAAYSEAGQENVNGAGGRPKSSAVNRSTFNTFKFEIKEDHGNGDPGVKKDEFDDEKIDMSMIPSLLTTMFNKLDASNLKQAAQKLANTETKAKAAVKASADEMEQAARKRAAVKEKEKQTQILEDVGLGFTTALMVLSLAALAFVTGGMGLAIAGAAITGIMTAMDIANRAIKYDEKATFTDSKGNQRHIEISISGAVDAAIEKAIENGDFHFPPGIKTPEEKEKYISEVKMGVSIAIQLVVMIVTISMSIGSVKQAAQAAKDATGIAAKAAMGFKAAMTATTESVEAGIQIASSATDAVKARKQFDIAIETKDGNLAENKANAHNFQADLLYAEGKQVREAMAKQSESVRDLIANVKKVLDALMEMDSKISYL